MVGIVQLGSENLKTSDSATLFPVRGALVVKSKTLTRLRKLCLTFWTSNADTPFSLRDTNLLITGRTFINMVCFALFHN